MWWTNGNGTLELQLSPEQFNTVAHSGDNEPAVRALLAQPSVAAQVAEWDADTVREHLREYGAWDEAELADEEMNLVRTLWLAAWDLHEEQLEELQP